MEKEATDGEATDGEATDGKVKKPIRKIHVVLAAAGLALLIGGYLYYRYTEDQAEQVRLEQQQAEQAAAAARAAALKNAAKREDPAAIRARDVAEYARLENAYINKWEVLRSEYQRTLDTTGWNKLLDSERLNKDKSLVESRAILQKAKEVVAKYRAQHLAMVGEALKDVAALKLSDSARQKVQQAVDTGGAYSAAAAGLFWDCEDIQIAAYEGIFTLLSNKKVTWAAQNGKVLFTEQSDLDVFNKHLTAMREAVKKEDELRQQQRDALDISLDDTKPAQPGSGEAKPGEAKAAETTPDASKVDAPKAEAPKPDATKK